MSRELVVRAADQGATYLTWRWADERQAVSYAVLDGVALDAVVDDIGAAVPHPRRGESDRDAAARALVGGHLTDREREAALATRMGAAVLPAELAGLLMAADEPVRLRLTPSPRLSRVPWELLALPDCRRLVQVADIVHDPPATLHAHRDRLPDVWCCDAPVLYVLDPQPRSPVLDEDGWTGLDGWLTERESTGRLRVRDRPLAQPGGVGRELLGERLRDPAPPSRLLYFGHATAGDAEPGSASLHLDDGPEVTGLARVVNGHRPFTALDLLYGTVLTTPHGEGRPGHLIWPMPPRVAIIACESGGDHRHLEPFGLVMACLNAGAELVTATRWTLPTDHAFTELVEDPTGRPTTELMRRVDHCHDQDDPVRQLAEWQRSTLAAWLDHGRTRDTPLLWASLTTHLAPGRTGGLL